MMKGFRAASESDEWAARQRLPWIPPISISPPVRPAWERARTPGARTPSIHVVIPFEHPEADEEDDKEEDERSRLRITLQGRRR